MAIHSQTTSLSSTRPKPPQVSGWPVWGALPDFYRDGIDFFLRNRETYGDIYRLDLVGTEVTVLGHPDYVQHVLRDNADNYRGKGDGRAFRASSCLLLGDGIVATDNQRLWRQQRRAIQPYFNHKHLLGLVDLIVEAIDSEITGWNNRVGEPFDIQPELTRMAIRNITSSLFGITVTPDETQQISQDIENSLGYLWSGMMVEAYPEGFPFPGQDQYEKTVDALDSLVDRLVERRHQARETRDDVMSVLLWMADPEGERKIDRKQIRDEIMTMLIATCESLSATLGFVFYYLSQYPAIRQNLHSETDQVLGQRVPVFNDISGLKYARMVMQETLRIAAPVYWIQRMAADDDEIDGFYIPAGSIVVPVIHLIHHHAEIWENPHRFKPERFLPEHSKARHKLAWIPFGTGRRLCTGQDYTLMYGQLLLACVFQQYDVVGTPSQQDSGIHLSTGLKRAGGVRVTLQKR